MAVSAFVSLDKYRADLAELNDHVRFYKTYFESVHYQLKLAYYALCQRRYNLAEQHLEQALKLCQIKPSSASVPVSNESEKFSSAADGFQTSFFEFEGER